MNLGWVIEDETYRQSESSQLIVVTDELFPPDRWN